MYKHICISMQVCTQLNMYIHCTDIHVHRCLHPHEHTCTQTQIYLLLLSLLPVSNPLAFHKYELWSLCYGYIEPQEPLKLIWFYSTSICAQFPEGPCRSHFFKVKISSFGELNLAWRGREKRLECRRHRRTELKLYHLFQNNSPSQDSRVPPD